MGVAVSRLMRIVTWPLFAAFALVVWTVFLMACIRATWEALTS